MFCRKRQFVHKNVVQNVCAPWTSNRIANTQTKLRRNSPTIANKQNYEQTGIADFDRFEKLPWIEIAAANWSKHLEKELTWQT